MHVAAQLFKPAASQGEATLLACFPASSLPSCCWCSIPWLRWFPLLYHQLPHQLSPSYCQLSRSLLSGQSFCPTLQEKLCFFFSFTAHIHCLHFLSIYSFKIPKQQVDPAWETAHKQIKAFSLQQPRFSYKIIPLITISHPNKMC